MQARSNRLVTGPGGATLAERGSVTGQINPESLQEGNK
jgi:hypothetical protein